MAIIQCPACGQRMSSLAETCPHCSSAVGRMSGDDRNRLARRRWRDQTGRTANTTYIALALLMGGAMWWWGAPPQGWFFPPPVASLVLLPIGLALYLVARSWLFWLRLPRNRPPPD